MTWAFEKPIIIPSPIQIIEDKRDKTYRYTHNLNDINLQSSQFDIEYIIHTFKPNDLNLEPSQFGRGMRHVGILINRMISIFNLLSLT